MQTVDFIENWLKNIAINFQEAKIRYEYRKSTQSHLIEILPLSFFEHEEAYLIGEIQFEDEFQRLFPNENLVFISEDSLTKIKHSDFELGYNYFVFDNSVNSDFNVEIVGVDKESSVCGYNFVLAA